MAEYLCEEDMNTGEYISRDLALKQLNATCLATDCDNYNGVRCRACAYADAMDFIDAIPAADVQPIRHGRWICNEELYYNGMTKCSCCNEEYYTEDIQNLQGDLRTVNYCPNCGARMDGDAE